MKPRTASAALDVRALYSIATLASIANVSRFRLLRLLRANKVRFVRGGRVFYVPFAEIERKIPSLFHSLRLIEQIRSPNGGPRPCAPRAREP